MRKTVFSLFALILVQVLNAQKKPLDHTVYDSWQSIGEKLISNDGRWVVYTVDPQEGDNELVIQSADASYKKTIPRGYTALITEDSRFLICRIKPYFKDARDARIKKKKPEDTPKDSLAIVELGKDSVWKLARVKNYKAPAKSFGWLAYHLEKPVEAAANRKPADGKKLTDSLNRVIDSLQALIENMPKRKEKNKDEESLGLLNDADGDDAVPGPIETGTDLLLRKLSNGEQKSFRNVLEYYFSKNGSKLLMEISRNPKDSLSKTMVILFDLRKGFPDTLSRGGNDFNNFTLSDDGSQVAYTAERDAKPKELQKFYKLWYYKEGMDSAILLADKNSVGMKIGMTVSENGNLSFSKSGKRLFFGTAPIQAPKDTSLVESETAKLDIWHYNDDYLQSQQLFRLALDLRTNYLAVYNFDNSSIHQLGSKELPTIYQTNEGDGERFIGVTDFGNRVEGQWMGNTKKDIYSINVNNGTKKLVKKDMLGVITPAYTSSTGKYILWYDSKAKNYFSWDGDSIRNISAKIRVPLYNEEHDSPSDPSPYGVMGWHEGDSILYVYDRYDIWKLDPSGRRVPQMLELWRNNSRKSKTVFRYLRTNTEERFITTEQDLLFRRINDNDKSSSLYRASLSGNDLSWLGSPLPVSFGGVSKARESKAYIFTKENYATPPDLYFNTFVNDPEGTDTRLSSINPQQKEYNWGTAELYKWKTFTGKTSEGILYKPEDFNPAKKYPLILYFYEKLSDGLNSYQAPSPTPSRLNISFFVSRGYLVFAPDISYTIGHPAKSAYDYIVSAAKDLAKNKWVDAKNMGLQGQSWGGIQVAQLITMTDIFKAAWAGAPVANMTSAYGGIRWESGANRQFQYEKTQSRIGATLWEKPALYIESSPLFHLPKVKTPLVIMSNDADGAVPWYQGIELYTGMRRLGKKVWLLNYNGEAHNLVQRRNRKDIQVREQQFFDWLLKGEKPARWLTEGVPAVKKGKDWGLEIVD